MSPTRIRLQAAINEFLQSLGRKTSQLSQSDDLHRDTGISSDEGVLLVLEIEDKIGVKLPNDFNAVVHESGKRGLRFQELIELVDAELAKEAVA